MIKLHTELTMRNDSQGLGHFGAPRGNRTHKGMDFTAAPGSELIAPVAGRVTKLGYCYNDDLAYRYIQITQSKCPSRDVLDDDGGDKCRICGFTHPNHRLFYTEPVVELNAFIEIGESIGIVQDVSVRYPGMTPHVHYEVKIGTKYIDPELV